MRAVMKMLGTMLSAPLFWGVVALGLYWGMLWNSPWVYPGESAAWMAHVMGVAPTTALTGHPLATLFFDSFARFLPMDCAVTLLNGVSGVFGALCVILFGLIIKGYFALCVSDNRSLHGLKLATNIAVPTGAATLLLMPNMILASSHLQWQTFDLFLLLSELFLVLWCTRGGSLARISMVSGIVGFITLESTTTVLAGPFLIAGLILTYYHTFEKCYWRVIMRRILLPGALGAVLMILTMMAYRAGVAKALDPDASVSYLGLITSFGLSLYGDLRGLLETNGWLLVGLFAVVPGILSFLSLRALGENVRTLPLLGVYITIGILSGCAMVHLGIDLPALQGDIYPLTLNVLVAFAVAFCCGGGVLLFVVRQGREGTSERRGIRTLSGIIGLIMLGVLPLVVVTGLLLWTPKMVEADRALAQLPKTVADNILTTADKGEVWLLSDGILDPYLAIRIAETQKPVVLFSRAEEARQGGALKRKLVQAMDASPMFKEVFEEQPQLRSALERSLVDIGDLFLFLQDWLRADARSTQHFVTLNLPDLWFAGNREPLPEGLWYRGAVSRAEREKVLLSTTFTLPDAFSDKALQVSDVTPDGPAGFAKWVRRHVGFMQNNTAYFLGYTAEKQRAYELFRATYAYDPDNASAFMNATDLLKGKTLEPVLPLTEEGKAQYDAQVQWISREREWCAQELNALKKRYKNGKVPLARHFGYIRSPQIMASTFGNWAMTGATGAALSHFDMQLELLEDNLITAAQKSALRMSVTANLYALMPEKRKESITMYRQLLEESQKVEESLTYLHQLIQLSLMEQELDRARTYLEEAEARAETIGKSADFAYLRALYHAANGEPSKAQVALQNYLVLYPQNIEATAMLATLQMQAGKFDEVRTVTMQKLITAANGTADNYFVKIIEAQLEEQAQQFKRARTAYLRALALRPDVTLLRNTILRLDMRLNDREAASEHARKFLYQDRKHPLSNYIMGSLALHEGDEERALAYLLEATDPDIAEPLPEAYNDLAETYRRLGHWTEAYATAQQAYKLAPRLAVAHETAASALLELGRTTEAHAELNQATDVEQKTRPNQPIDPRILITRARIYEKEQKLDMARMTLAEAHKQYAQLDPGAKAAFDQLAKTLQMTF